MNDFSELESELKKLRPARASAGLVSRIERAMADAGESVDNIIRPQSRPSGPVAAATRTRPAESSEFRISWLGLGAGLAAAATFLILARVDLRPGDKTKAEPANNTLASATPTLEQKAAALPNYQATGLTQVVYKRYDQGLVYPRGASGPSRRVWTAKRETLRWRDRETGAQLVVSYPAEEVTLIPVSGQ
jgi:hypothetical protein